VFALLISSVLAYAAPPQPKPFDLSFSRWDSVLRVYSKEGLVDYRRLKLNGDLEPFLAQLAAVKEEELSSWTKQQRLAFWINAYNAFTLKGVLRLYPIPPRRKCQYPEAKSSSWDPFGCPANSPARIPDMWTERSYDVAGRKLSLDEIQNELLRGFGETRVMFALSKASKGCPVLRGEAYKSDRVLAQLDGDVQRFAQSKACLDVDVDNMRIGASPVLRWYTDWFDAYDDGTFESYPKDARGPLAYLGRVMGEYEYAPIKARPFQWDWMKYDWALNDLPLLEK
jgi:hypothetical protein